MSGPEALGKPQICPFIQSANPVNRCSECKLGLRVMSEKKQADFQRRGRDVSPFTHDCALTLLAGKFAGPMVAAVDGLANTIEGHIQTVEKHLLETVEVQVAKAIDKAMAEQEERKVTKVAAPPRKPAKKESAK